MRSRLLFVGVTALLALVLSGCASYRHEREVRELQEKGQFAESVKRLRDMAEENPARYRRDYVQWRDKVTHDLLRDAYEARRAGDVDRAKELFQEILIFDPLHREAASGLEIMARQERHQVMLDEANALLVKGDQVGALSVLSRILAEDADYGPARAMKQRLEIDRNRSFLSEPAITQALRKPVSLEFREASIHAVFEVLSRSSGINFIFDKDVGKDIRTTIFARDTSIEDALRLILRTSQLDMKVLNDSTLMIFPDTKDKRSLYADLVIRTFYLSSADPGKVQGMIRELVAPQSMYIDEAMRMLVVRDRMEVVQTIERLIDAYDIISPEVELEVEIFEVSSDSLLNLGIQYPDRISASVAGAAGQPGQLTVDEIRNLDKSNFTLFVPDPLVVGNFKQTSGKANTLANPRIRVSNREEAKILIGDKVPVITTTTNPTSGSSSESVSYLDVGLKLGVVPEIHVNREVSIQVELEVSNIVKEIKSSTGLLTYQIGTRMASTALRLQDGETQMLAGLIRDDTRDSASHIPLLGKLPLVGRFFSNETNTSAKSEIVLLITPRITRGLATPAANTVEFSSGTQDRVTTRPLRLTPAGDYSSRDTSLLEPDSADGLERGRNSPSAEVFAVDPAVADGRLDLLMPGQIGKERDFLVTLIHGGRSFKSIAFDLLLDEKAVQLVEVVSVGGLADVNVERSDDGLRIEAGALRRTDGPFLALKLRAGASSGDDVGVSFRDVQAVGQDGNPLLIAIPQMKRMRLVE